MCRFMGGLGMWVQTYVGIEVVDSLLGAVGVGGCICMCVYVYVGTCREVRGHLLVLFFMSHLVFLKQGVFLP